MNEQRIIDLSELDALAAEAGGYVVPFPSEREDFDIRGAATLAQKLGRTLTDSEFDQFLR